MVLSVVVGPEDVKMVVCNLFSVDAHVLDDRTRVVQVVIRTDLPSGTQIIYSVDRTYLDKKGELSLWVGQGDRIVVDRSNECHLDIDIDASDEMALDYFRQLNSGSFPSGNISPVSDTVDISFVVGARQRLKEFGRNNSELTGMVVREAGSVKIVESRHQFCIPMEQKFQPPFASL